jgi:ABC-2 type transport system ATP-binding protein
MAETQGEQVVSVRGLTKVFRDFWRRPKVRAVDGLDLEVRRGEVFGLLGPNGSGKSTTLKILLGLLDPTAGSVSVLGRPPRHVRTKRAIGYLPENSDLYGYLTPRETLTFYGRLFPLEGRTIAERVEQLLDMTGLRAAAHRPVGEFSKGMARRLGLAQALINTPRLLLLDEPTSGLDPIGCRQVKDLIRSLARHGATVILSSHLLADVEDVCDRIAILYNGRLRAMGSVRALLEQPDRWRITLPVLSPEKTRALLAAVREQAGQEPEVDRPAMNLERFFLRVVEDAAGAPPRTAGIARYLEDAATP